MFQPLYGNLFEITVGNEKLPEETAHHAVNAFIRVLQMLATKEAVRRYTSRDV